MKIARLGFWVCVTAAVYACAGALLIGHPLFFVLAVFNAVLAKWHDFIIRKYASEESK